MNHCVVCGEITSNPFAAVVYHFRPFEWHEPKYIIGNIRAFGFWAGMRANISLYFPFANTLIHWKYRKMKLAIETEEKP